MPSRDTLCNLGIKWEQSCWAQSKCIHSTGENNESMKERKTKSGGGELGQSSKRLFQFEM